MTSPSVRRWLAAGVALAALTVPTANAGMALDYRLYVGGLHALSLTTLLSSDGEADNYHMAVTAHTDGLVARIVEASYVAEVSGTTVNGSVLPARFRGTSNDEDEGERSVTLSWSESVPAVVFDPADEAPDTPLGDDLIDGTVDPTSAVLTLMQTLAANGSCEARIRVFDGKRRYDMVSRHGEMVTG